MPHVRQLPPTQLSKLLWAFSVLEVQPVVQLQQLLLAASYRQLPITNGQDCAMLLLALGRLKLPVPPRWMAACCERLSQAVQPQLKLLPPAGLNMLADVLHKLHLQPSPAWKQDFTAAAVAGLWACDARSAAVLAVPLVRWQCELPAGWLQQYLSLTRRLVRQMQPQALAVLGHTLAALRAEPSMDWLLEYLTAAQHCSLANSPAGCSLLLHILGTWKPLQQAAVAYAASGRTTSQPWQRSTGTGRSEPAMLPAGVRQGLRGKSVDQDEEAVGSLGCLLVQQCAASFLLQGDAFTAEQLGMFCSGVTRLGLVGSKGLCQKLHKVGLLGD
eukprot:gene7842-8039_t